MSTLLSRIMLALLMLPLATLIYVVVIVTLTQFAGGFAFGPTAAGFVFADLVTAAFVATYWMLLWRRTVRWTRRRIGFTIGAAFGALTPALILGGLVTFVNNTFGAFISGVTAILLWLTLTIFIWRETRAERMARIRSHSGELIVCPSCGYNLTGLRQPSCPECGATYTLDELVALQPAREATDI